MDLNEIQGRLKWVPPWILSAAERYLKRIPRFRAIIEKEYDEMLSGMEASLKPYRRDFPSYAKLPEVGRGRAEIMGEMNAIQAHEESRWRDGFVSGAVYNDDQSFIDFLNEVYAVHSQSNALHTDVWPSASKFEAEVVAMTANMLGASQTTDAICGSVSSGGTESILLAMKSYRDWARDTKGITDPNIIAPTTAHPAFDKAGNYFGIKVIRVPVDQRLLADPAGMKRKINRNTIAMVGTAGTYPHGVVDPIPELSEIARHCRIGFHTDGCLGGFILPWAEKLGYNVTPFDFRLPGVTSISADTHKYGYAAKGTSVVLYRGLELRRYQYFAAIDWPGGFYTSPTFAGSRSGALIAACWAALVSTGEDGYLAGAQRILETAARIRSGIEALPGFHLLGESFFTAAFASDEVNIYDVLDFMASRGWSLNPLQKPAGIHLSVTLRHTQPGVSERFIDDLQAAATYVKAHPSEHGNSAPLYGTAATIPMRGLVTDLLKHYIDLLSKI
ncbi:MAG TPA: aminotransferase class V-fold PLP-dependent enzyme [Anaerolineales bacterium]|nr:aminotransferase class V-fold PLP-dependent enzyme [Anaerolineales bacterium]